MNKHKIIHVAFVFFVLIIFCSNVSAKRYYSSNMRQFTQPDTVIPNAYNPQALNRYAYAYNNPLKYIDPSGHEPVTSEYGTVDSVSTKMSQIRQSLGDSATDADLYRAMANYYSTSVELDNGQVDALYRVEGVSRYVYTEGKGSLDMKHVFGAAADAAEQGSLKTFARGYGLEGSQLFGIGASSGKVPGSGNQQYSGFTIEDIPSNYVGIKMQRNSDGGSALDAENSFDNLMSSYGASDPSSDPKHSSYGKTEFNTFSKRSYKIPWILPSEAPNWWK